MIRGQQVAIKVKIAKGQSVSQSVILWLIKLASQLKIPLTSTIKRTTFLVEPLTLRYDPMGNSPRWYVIPVVVP